MADASRIRVSDEAIAGAASADPSRTIALAPFARSRRIALHHQIRDDLIANIESGQFSPGAELPGEAALCAHYSASRGTIRQALAELAREGLIERYAGRGSFLRQPKIEGNVVGSYRQFRIEGPPLDPGGAVLAVSRRMADEYVSGILGLTADRTIYFLRRLRYANGVPVTLQTSYLPVSLCPDLPRHDLGERHLVDILQKEYAIVLARAEELIDPTIIGAADAKRLGVRAGSAVFRIERRTFLPDGRVGEFRRAIMRGDIYRYRLDLR